jgi:hypothetical protein
LYQGALLLVQTQFRLRFVFGRRASRRGDPRPKSGRHRLDLGRLAEGRTPGALLRLSRSMRRGFSKPAPGRSLAELRPALALQWDGKKNGTLTPSDVTGGSGLKV